MVSLSFFKNENAAKELFNDLLKTTGHILTITSAMEYRQKGRVRAREGAVENPILSTSRNRLGYFGGLRGDGMPFSAATSSRQYP